VAKSVPNVSIKLDEPLEFVGLGAIVLALGWGMYVLGKRAWRSAFRTRNRASFKVVAAPWGSNQGPTSSSVIRFQRRLSQWAKTQSQLGHLPSVWFIVMGLVGGATAGGLAFKFLPNFEVRSSTAAASVDFRLCGSALEQNCVIDGDTIRYGGEKIRLVGFDTPEISSPKCTSELELGQRAKHRLVELMNAGPFEVSATGGPDRDVYGRKLRIISRDGQSIGDTLIAEGLARRWEGARRSWCG
jgi:endonuclease YncB( thermonuclease family)